VLTELIAISGVFLISGLLPAVLGDPTVLDGAASPAGAGTAPLLLALAGGAGVGALIVMTGRSVWAALFAYRGTRVGRFLRRKDTSFHKRSAELYPGLRTIAGKVSKSSATVDSLTTTLMWHGFADQHLLDFTRRRHGMFSENLNAATAIAFGLACSQLLTGLWTWQRAIVTVALAALAGVSLASGWQARKKAEQVEELWHLLASRNLLSVSALIGPGEPSVAAAAAGAGPAPKRGQTKPPA
jgi:uncharacterized membrane protein YphA (DoxX/SURF4 family)